MGTGRTAWHVGFAALLTERAPAWIEVRSEVVLTLEPQRAGLLLLRRAHAESAGGGPRVLRRLWDLFQTDALLEFKSVSRPCRRGDVVRLLGYGAQYHAENLGRVVTPADLALVLVVADVNAALRDELGTMSWTLDDLGGGYMAVLGCPYRRTWSRSTWSRGRSGTTCWGHSDTTDSRRAKRGAGGRST